MTDNEIIKALPTVAYGGHSCGKCKYRHIKDENRCGLKGCLIARNALDLIHRQKAEVEKLKEENQRITENFNCQQIVCGDFCEIIKKQADELKQAKSEAIKEFWNRVRTYAIDMGSVHVTVFGDNLVKEMTEKE